MILCLLPNSVTITDFHSAANEFVKKPGCTKKLRLSCRAFYEISKLGRPFLLGESPKSTRFLTTNSFYLSFFSFVVVSVAVFPESILVIRQNSSHLVESL